MSGSHYAPAPDGDDYTYDLRTLPDCTAWPEQAKAQLAALRVEVERLALRVNRLEEIVAAQRAAIERLADALTVIQLRAGL